MLFDFIFNLDSDFRKERLSGTDVENTVKCRS